MRHRQLPAGSIDHHQQGAADRAVLLVRARPLQARQPAGRSKAMKHRDRELPMRLALRTEGDKWNAYISKPDTMDGAIWVGSIAMRFVEGHQKRRDAFIAL